MRIVRFIPIFLITAFIFACQSTDAEPPVRPSDEEVDENLWDELSSPPVNTTIRVNKYLWSASLDVLDFLPLESADPFTGILQYGYGRARGSTLRFRATVLIQDPALDPRSLKLALLTNDGPADI